MTIESLASRGVVPYLAPGDSPYIFDSCASIDKIVDEYLPFPADLVGRSVAIPGSDSDGFSHIYRNSCFPRGIKEALVPGFDTIHTTFEHAVTRFASDPIFASRPYDYATGKSEPRYETMTYGEVHKLRDQLGLGVMYLLARNQFLDPSQFDSHQKVLGHRQNFADYNVENISFILTLYLANRWEWSLTELMCSLYGITNTALYDTLGEDTSEYILEMTELPVIVCSKNHIEKLLGLKRRFPEKLGSLIQIISIDPLDGPAGELLKEAATKGCVELVDFDQTLKIGAIFPLETMPSGPNALHTISYTLGTTGSHPKGVMLTQRTACAGILFLTSRLNTHGSKKSFAFLPFAHIFERQNSLIAMSTGGTIGFPQIGGSPLTLVEDLKLFKPNSMANVPRVYGKFESVLKAATTESESWAKRSIFAKAIATKMGMQAANTSNTLSNHMFYDILLKKLRGALGFDEMNFVTTGLAPINPSTIRFLKGALNIGMLQGYGLTESFAGVSLSLEHEPAPGACGLIGISAEMKLREVPEMGYMKGDKGGPRGELLLRGAQIFSGYFKNEKETALAVDSDGWFHTGDVAQICLPQGHIKIIDRVKNFFKLAQGEYVAPEKIENIYLSRNSILTQCWAYGDSLRSHLVGVVGIDPEAGRKFLAKEFGVTDIPVGDTAAVLALLNEPQHKAKLLRKLNARVGSRLYGFERLKNIYIEVEPLTLERDLITPTVKIKRPISARFFKDQIHKMYDVEGDLSKNKAKI